MTIRPVVSLDELVHAYEVAGSTLSPPVDSSHVNHRKIVAAWPGCADLCLVADDGRGVVGAVLGLAEGSDAFIALLGVVPGSRGGVGRW